MVGRESAKDTSLVSSMPIKASEHASVQDQAEVQEGVVRLCRKCLAWPNPLFLTAHATPVHFMSNHSFHTFQFGNNVEMIDHN